MLAAVVDWVGGSGRHHLDGAESVRGRGVDPEAENVVENGVHSCACPRAGQQASSNRDRGQLQYDRQDLQLRPQEDRRGRTCSSTSSVLEVNVRGPPFAATLVTRAYEREECMYGEKELKGGGRAGRGRERTARPEIETMRQCNEGKRVLVQSEKANQDIAN